MKILVVDDDPQIIKLFVQSLKSRPGADVRGVVTGEKALEVVQEMGGIDILFSDVVMQGMDGFTLHKALLEMCPDLRTVFMSGYDLADYADYLNGNIFLAKPTDLDGIMEALDRALQSESGSAALELSGRSDGSPGVVTPIVDPDTGRHAGDSRTRSANLRNLVQKQGFTGKLDQFQLVDIIQMCCLSRRTGRLQISKGLESGVIFLKEGNIVHAVTGALEGEQGVYKIISWDFGQFSFEDGLLPNLASITSSWEHLVMEGVRLRDEHGQGREETPETEGLLGRTLGPYQIVRKIGEGNWGETYEAIQTSMERPVALKVLWKDLGNDPQALQEFIAAASAKANVAHPFILSVYEAGESEGRYFYARELVDGLNIKDLKAQGRTIDDPQALQIIRTAAEALSYLSQNKIPHKDFGEESIYIGNDKRPRLANLATPNADLKANPQAEIRTLSKVVGGAMQAGAGASPGLRALLSRMLIEGTGGFPSYGALLQAVKAIEPKVMPADAHKLTEKDRAAIAAVEDAKRRQKRALLFSSIGMFVLIWVALGVIYFKFIKPVERKNFDLVVEIPAGEFIYQEGEKVNLPKFYIDQYEVTIGQYAEFLDALEKNPTTLYDHPEMPRGKSHKPQYWEYYYAAAKGNVSRGTFRGAPVDLNSPVMLVNWFDAYAYSKWRGGRLPTEQEWEKAARGTDGFKYPWGNEFRTKGVNTAADYAEDARINGRVDGYNRWAPVDGTMDDRSPYGVIGMAGNVSEWTATWGETTTAAKSKVPVIRGGNFASADCSLSRRILELTEFGSSDRIGFRVAYDKVPENTKLVKPN